MALLHAHYLICPERELMNSCPQQPIVKTGSTTMLI